MVRDFTRADNVTKLLRTQSLIEAVQNEIIFSLPPAAAESVTKLLNEALALVRSMIPARVDDAPENTLVPE